MEWNCGMEWNGFFGMEYEMRIFTYTFDVRVTNVIFLDERGHSHDNTYFRLLTQV